MGFIEELLPGTWDQLSPGPAAVFPTEPLRDTCRGIHVWSLPPYRPGVATFTRLTELSFACRLVLSCRGGVPWWLVLHFIEKGSGPQPSLINAALPLHTQVHVCMFPLHVWSLHCIVNFFFYMPRLVAVVQLECCLYASLISLCCMSFVFS